MTNNIHISTAGPQADITLIDIRGFLDTLVAYTLQEQVNTLMGAGMRKYIIDLEELEHISSAGIGFFSGLVLELRKYHGKLVFINIPEHVQDLLKLMRLIEIFTVGQNLQDALILLENNTLQPA